MIDSYITYAALISQILLLSYYYPKQIMDRINYILGNYPAATHPKLYPLSNGEQNAQKGLRIYKRMTYSTGIIGIIALITAIINNITIVAPVAFGFAMLQFVPILITEISEFKYYKLMQSQNRSSKRSARIKPRRFFDYIAPWKFAIAAIMLLGYLSFNFYRVGFDLSIKSDGFITLVTMILVHLMFASIIMWRLHGKKLNPHQSSDDRERDIEGVIKSMVYVSMLMSSFLFIFGLIQHYALDHYETAAISIYLQLCAFLSLGTMLKANNLEKINFDVYRENAEKTLS